MSEPLGEKLSCYEEGWLLNQQYILNQTADWNNGLIIHLFWIEYNISHQARNG